MIGGLFSVVLMKGAYSLFTQARVLGRSGWVAYAKAYREGMRRLKAL